MANIINYIKWRGDIDFYKDPFNEVDNLGLSLLIYNDFGEIVPGKDASFGISVSEALEKWLKTHSVENLGRFSFEWVLYYMAKSKRFGNLIISDYVDINDSDRNMLFTAFTIHLPDGSLYVAYRGTTMEIEDFRLDFQISFEEIEAQRAAARYLKHVMKKYPGDVYVGGHSKGGNLAVYAAMYTPEEDRDRIKRIYSNDGPGFSEELLDEARFEIIKDRIIHIVPAFCVIGMVFELDVPHEIVASSADKMTQHDGMTWKIEGNHFVRRKHLDEESSMYNRAIDDWIGNATIEQRKAFTKDVFDAMKAGGAVNVNEISQGGFHDFGTVLLSAANSEKETKIVIGKFFRSVWRTFEKVRLVETFKSFTGIIDMFMIFLGIIFFTIPEDIYKVLGGAIALLVAVWSAMMLLKAGVRDEKPHLKRGRMIFHLVIMWFMVFIMSNLERIPKWTNFLMAIVFFSLTVASISYIIKHKDIITGKTKFWMMFLAVVNTYIGIVSIAMPARLDFAKSFTLGSYLIIVGIVRLVIQLSESTYSSDYKEKTYFYEDEDIEEDITKKE